MATPVPRPRPLPLRDQRRHRLGQRSARSPVLHGPTNAASAPFWPAWISVLKPAIRGGPALRFGGASSGTELRERQNRPVRIGSALFVAGVAEVPQFPDRVVLVGLDQLATAIPGDLDVTDAAEVGPVEVGPIGCDAFDPLDRLDHPV